MRHIKRLMPWWARFWTRTLLAQVGINYRVLRALGLTRHGAMEEPAVAFETFMRHARAAGFPRNGEPSSVLELGPGDSLNTALIAAAMGASRVHLIDASPDARLSLQTYRQMIDFLRERGLDVSRIERFDDVQQLLANCNATYETDGLAALQRLPDASVDFVFSNAVLQHVRRHDLPRTLRELRRILKPGGAASHSIGIWDQMGFALNHLRFSRRFWESQFVARAGCYTNRVRFSQMVRLMERCGFDVEVTEVNRWSALPTPRARMDRMFHRFDDSDLRVYSYNVTLRRAASGRQKRIGSRRATAVGPEANGLRPGGWGWPLPIGG